MILRVTNKVHHRPDQGNMILYRQSHSSHNSIMIQCRRSRGIKIRFLRGIYEKRSLRMHMMEAMIRVAKMAAA